jgi:hypothetical protein
LLDKKPSTDQHPTVMIAERHLGSLVRARARRLDWPIAENICTVHHVVSKESQRIAQESPVLK